MGIFIKKITTGDSANTDVLADSEVADSANYRRVARIGCGGSTAIGDTKMSLYYGNIWIATFYNTGTAQIDDQDLRVISQRKWCPPSLPIRLVIDDAPNADALILMDIQEMEPWKMRQAIGRFRRPYRRAY